MPQVILAAVATVAIAAPSFTGYEEPEPPKYVAPASSFRQETFSSVEHIPILRNDQVLEEDGHYNFAVETGNGIVISQSGSPSGPEGAVVKTGEFS